MDDGKIIQLFLDRDENAIREVEKKYASLCFGISKNILKNPSDAEECVNDTYLALWNAIPPETPRHLMAYTAGITRMLSLKRLEYQRAKKRSAPDPLPFSELEEVLKDAAFLESESEEEIGKLIEAFLLTEKEEARNVFLRKYWFFDSIDAIAARYAYSESKVKSMLFQTRKRLKKYLQTKGVNV